MKKPPGPPGKPPEDKKEQKKKPLSLQKLKEVKTAAFLKSQGMRYLEIGGIMFEGVKRPEPRVSKLITIARDLGYLLDILNPDRFTTEEIEALSLHLDKDKWDELRRLLVSNGGPSLKTLTVCFSGSSDADSEADRIRQAIRFANNAAPHIFKHLMTCQQALGVAWGPTLSEIAAALQQLRAVQGSRLGVLDRPVLPTVGLPEELSGSVSPWSSTQVASDISLAMRRTRDDVPSLESIPAVLTGVCAEDEDARKIIFQFLKSRQSYRKIYGSGNGDPGLIHETDALLSGVGTSTRWPSFGRDALQPEGIPPKLIQDLTVGDIGGVLIRRPEIGNDAAKLEQFKNLRTRWTGLTLKQLKTVNVTAQRSGGPGVIVAAMGASKADICLELVVNHDLIRHLVIDQHLAGAMWDRLLNREST